jgi:hypothetical protein
MKKPDNCPVIKSEVERFLVDCVMDARKELAEDFDERIELLESRVADFMYPSGKARPRTCATCDYRINPGSTSEVCYRFYDGRDPYLIYTDKEACDKYEPKP